MSDELVEGAQAHVFAYRQLQHQAIPLAILGDVGDTGGQTVGGGAWHQYLAINLDRAAADGAGAVDELHQLGTPGPHQAAEAQNFPLAQGETHPAHAGTGQILHLQADGTELACEARILFLQPATHHHLDDPVFVELAHRLLAYPFAIAQHGDPVADLEDLLEAVGDVNDAATLLAQLADDHEQLLCLGVGQGVGGLVHDDDAGIE
ncbi:hypothetical protein D3C80_844950 [compost metagenome]